MIITITDEMLNNVLDETKIEADPRRVVVLGVVHGVVNGVVALVELVVVVVIVVVVVVTTSPPPIMLPIQLRWLVTRVKAPGLPVRHPGD